MSGDTNQLQFAFEKFKESLEKCNGKIEHYDLLKQNADVIELMFEKWKLNFNDWCIHDGVKRTWESYRHDCGDNYV